uniref:Uncharacterized protein n=1 Tax=Anguilla anguilla TaxID=7936 RepID=A0A0E9QCF6_ANGAN
MQLKAPKKKITASQKYENI